MRSSRKKGEILRHRVILRHIQKKKVRDALSTNIIPFASSVIYYRVLLIDAFDNKITMYVNVLSFSQRMS